MSRLLFPSPPCRPVPAGIRPACHPADDTANSSARSRARALDEVDVTQVKGRSSFRAPTGLETGTEERAYHECDIFSQALGIALAVPFLTGSIVKSFLPSRAHEIYSAISKSVLWAAGGWAKLPLRKYQLARQFYASGHGLEVEITPAKIPPPRSVTADLGRNKTNWNRTLLLQPAKLIFSNQHRPIRKCTSCSRVEVILILLLLSVGEWLQPIPIVAVAVHH